MTRPEAILHLFEALFVDLAEIGIVVTQVQVTEAGTSVLYGLRLTPEEALDGLETPEL